METGWEQLTKDSGIPDRRKGLLVGLLGGLFGAWVARYYGEQIVTRLFPEADQTLTETDDELPAAQGGMLALERQYQPGETVSEAVGRVAYRQLTGETPSKALQMTLAEGVRWLAGVAAGGAYGGSRTTTRAIDLPGGFFYGIRLWIADELFTPGLGLRARQSAFPLAYHLARLSVFEVYSFTTTAVTRVLYKLIERAG